MRMRFGEIILYNEANFLSFVPSSLTQLSVQVTHWFDELTDSFSKKKRRNNIPDIKYTPGALHGFIFYLKKEQS